MVMQKIMLSPCLICENENIYDWVSLKDILLFIRDFLDCGLDSIEGSIYHMDSWYAPPAFEINIFNYFTTYIFPILSDLLRKGDDYHLEGSVKSTCSDIQNSDYVITNSNEVKLLVYYTQHINSDYVLFVGKPNYQLKGKNIEISSEKQVLLVPVVKNPYLEENDSFNSFIKKDLTESTQIFMNKELCVKLDEKMKAEAKGLYGLKGSHYKKYGEIIALRNNYVEYNPKNPYNKDTKYFIRNDGKYIISIDLLHGHFEVFHGGGEQLWFAAYNFSGEEIYVPSSKKELETMRTNHKVES